ncbi:VWA domain-containing protein [Candidatus Pacearchaeota archaeon]|nr:VWA domain-containing protein [Candidatus Pacearchaeota archaeon]
MELFFLFPRYLFFLFIIPFFVLIHFVSLKTYRTRALRFANFEAIARIKGVDFYSKNLIVLLLTCFLLIIVVFTLAGLTLRTELEASSFSFVIAIDSSASMSADDLEPSRLESAKETAFQFVKESSTGTDFGIISFSSAALIEQEVTDNRDLVYSGIKNIKLNSAGGTNLYDALILGANILRGYDSRSIILLSDGQTNIGNLQDAIDYANDNNLIVHAIAIGTSEGGESNYGLTKIDEESLQSISYNTKGSYFKVTGNDELKNAFSKISELRKKKISINLSNYLLLLSIILIVIIYYLANSRYRTIP